MSFWIKYILYYIWCIIYINLSCVYIHVHIINIHFFKIYLIIHTVHVTMQAKTTVVQNGQFDLVWLFCWDQPLFVHINIQYSIFMLFILTCSMRCNFPSVISSTDMFLSILGQSPPIQSNSTSSLHLLWHVYLQTRNNKSTCSFFNYLIYIIHF